MSTDVENSKAFLRKAFDDVYDAIAMGKFPEWYIEGIPSYEKNVFENGELRDTTPRFLEVLGQKLGQELLENNGNALSAISASKVIHELGEFLFRVKYSDSRFAGEISYPFNLLEVRQDVEKVIEMNPKRCMDLIHHVVVDAYTEGPGRRELEDFLHKIAHKTLQIEGFAEGKLCLDQGEIKLSSEISPNPRSKKRHFRISGFDDDDLSRR